MTEGTVWQQKEILLIHMFVVSKHVIGFCHLATDQLNQESSSYSSAPAKQPCLVYHSLLVRIEFASKKPDQVLEQSGLGNTELLLAWKICFSSARSKGSSFKFSSVLLSGNHVISSCARCQELQF